MAGELPKSVRDVLLDILYRTMLQIRIAGWGGNAELCAAVADQGRNIPAIVETGKPELLDYYLDVEVPCFRSRVTAEDCRFFEANWSLLEKWRRTTR